MESLKYKIIFLLLILMLIIMKKKEKGNNSDSFFKTDEKNLNYLKIKYNSFLKDTPYYKNTHETNKTIF